VRVKNERAIELDKVDADDVQAVLGDESAVLADLHRNHLDDASKLGAYIAAVTDLEKELKSAAEAFATMEAKTVRSLKSALRVPGAFDRACSARKLRKRNDSTNFVPAKSRDRPSTDEAI
jgi:NADPH-dependent ferric siderophore reductase